VYDVDAADEAQGLVPFRSNPELGESTCEIPVPEPAEFLNTDVNSFPVLKQVSFALRTLPTTLLVSSPLKSLVNESEFWKLSLEPLRKEDEIDGAEEVRGRLNCP